MSDHLNCEVELTKGHVPYLVEHLSEFAYKWKDLGTVLKFQPQNLRNIEASPVLIATAPQSFMQRLVEEWLEGKHPHTAPPTLANLLKALKSYTVSLGTLATSVENLLPQCKSNSSGKFVAKEFKIALLTKYNEISYLKNSVTVNENMHFHLKIEIEERISEDTEDIDSEESSTEDIAGMIKCEWSNTGPVPMTDEIYSDIYKPILCISKADIDLAGGRYTCKIAEKSISTILKVSCPQLDEHKGSLASIYLAQPEVPQDSWPPVSNNTYINLALIKQQSMINYGELYAHLTVRGDMDDILHDKEKIEYKNIFERLRSGSLLLIEGRPGSGKTTFVFKITRDWASNEVRGPMRLLLLVSLRVLNSWEKPVILEDILQLLNVQVSPIILQERDGKGVCFIFDGLDEFSPIEGEKSIIHKIINKKYLPKSIVIVASRPAALVKLRQRADRVIEVIGFPKDQIFEYIENYPFSGISNASNLKSYLSSHPNVLHMCYLPIHTAMVAFLFEVTGKVPRTETEIYKYFTRFTLMRSLTKCKGQDELVDLDADDFLSGIERELFGAICEHAFEITKSNKQVLDQDKKIKQLQKSKDVKGISLGLVTVDRTAGLYGFKNIYTFLHLTYQEYLAAHYISSLSNEDQLQLIKQYGGTDHMQVVWKFYCGLVNFEGHEYKIRALISGRNEIGLFDIQCAYESQQEIVCNIFTMEMDAQIMLEDRHLTTTDFTALGYLLANNYNMPVSLSLIKCDLTAESANTLLAEIGERTLSFCTLNCESNKTDLSALISILRNSSELALLSLVDCDILDTEAFDTELALSTEIGEIPKALILQYSYGVHSYDLGTIRKLLTLLHVSLEHLNVIINTSWKTHDLEFSDIINKSLANLKELSLNVQVGPKTLSNVFQFCKELTSLTLNHSIEESCIEALMIEFPKCQKLETLSFSVPRCRGICYIDFTSSGVNFDDVLIGYPNFLYVQGIRVNYFQALRLETHAISTADLKFFSKYWPPRPKLFAVHQTSSIHNNLIPIIADCVSDFSAIETLMLTNIKIMDSNSKLLTKILSCCVMLQEVDLSHAKNTSEITTVLAGLKNCSSLQKLVLNGMSITTEGACALASSLQHWPKLQELNLRGCGIEEEGAEAIAHNIKKYCPKLIEVDASMIPA